MCILLEEEENRRRNGTNPQGAGMPFPFHSSSFAPLGTLFFPGRGSYISGRQGERSLFSANGVALFSIRASLFPLLAFSLPLLSFMLLLMILDPEKLAAHAYCGLFLDNILYCSTLAYNKVLTI